MHNDSTAPASSEEFFLGLIASGTIEITADGRIVRLIDRRMRDPAVQPRPIEYLMPSGYSGVMFRSGGRTFSMKSHRLVYRHVFGPIPEGMQINHKNGVKTDNHPENLEAVTPSENTRHAYRNGLIRVASGERSGNAKLSDADALEIRRAYAAGEATQQALADRYGIRSSSVSDIVRGKTRAAHAGPISTDNIRRKLETAQRQEVVSLWISGELTQKQIGDRFGIVPRTVRSIIRKAAALADR